MLQEKVDIQALRVTKELPTGAGLIVKDSNAQNIIVVDMGANKLFSKEDVFNVKHLINDSDVALAQLEIPIETALYGLRIAKSLGKKTVFNPAPARDLTQFDLSDVDYLTPNETEARVALGLQPDANITNEQAAEKLLETGCKHVVMTLGDQGSAIYSKEGSKVIPPCKVEVVDSNGAGDSFNAALSVALAENKSIEEAVLFANATAALCCMDWETVPSYKTREQVELFYSDNTKRAK
ncbi:ribokinase [Vibrio variabilis]|uniref:Ribokinase n=1 Tax=Vibrio variabilis TaxID=990271 RepID=A0ABQ0J6M1_9VIBR|nr:ribokinase [Vibrio variabilis]